MTRLCVTPTTHSSRSREAPTHTCAILRNVCAITHSRVFHGSFTCVLWLVHVCASSHSGVWHDSTGLARACSLGKKKILYTANIRTYKYIAIYAYIKYIYTYTYTYTWTHSCMTAWVRQLKWLKKICLNGQLESTCQCRYICVYIYVYIYVCTCVYIYVHI